MLSFLLSACGPQTCPDGFDLRDDGNCYQREDTAADSPYTLGDPIITIGTWPGGYPSKGDDFVEWMDAAAIDSSTALMVGQGGYARLDLDSATITEQVHDMRGYRVAIDGGQAAIATRTAGVMVVDTQTLNRTGDYAGPGGTHEDIAADGGRILVGWKEQGGILLDADLNELGRLEADSAFAVGLSGDRALLTDGDQLVLFDITDPANAAELDRVTTAGEGRDIAFDGSHIAVGMGGSGVGIYALESDTLAHRGDLSVPGSAFSVALDGDYLWIAAWEVVALAWIGEGDPVVLGHESPQTSAMGLGAVDGRAAVADWYNATALQRIEGVAGPELVLPERIYLPSDSAVTLPVENGGAMDLSIDFTLPPDVALSATSLVLSPGDKQNLLLSVPDDLTTSSIISWTSNDPDEPSGGISVSRSSQGVGTVHEDFTVKGFVWPDTTASLYTLSEHLGEVVFLAYWSDY